LLILRATNLRDQEVGGSRTRSVAWCHAFTSLYLDLREPLTGRRYLNGRTSAFGACKPPQPWALMRKPSKYPCYFMVPKWALIGVFHIVPGELFSSSALLPRAFLIPASSENNLLHLLDRCVSAPSPSLRPAAMASTLLACPLGIA
jgi:hypothetical protein